MTRKTRTYQLKDLLGNIEYPSSWSTGIYQCFSCRKSINGNTFNTLLGDICINCVADELKKAARAVDLSDWSSAKFMEALETSGILRSRLAVLWRFAEILQIVDKENQSDIEQLKKLLITNLGYVSKHPLAQIIRQAAFESCVQIGKSLSPLLLNMCRSTPWQFYANVVVTLSQIDPHNPEVQALIKKAAREDNPGIRKRAQAALSPTGSKKSTSTQRLHAMVHNIIQNVSNQALTNTQIKDVPEGKSQALQLITPKEKKLEPIIDELYTAESLKRIYITYLQDFFSEADFAIKGKFSINKLRKNDLIRTLAKVYANKSMFQTLFTMLSEEIKKILHLLVWEGVEKSAEHLEQKYKIEIVNRTKKYGFSYSAQDILNDYLIFQVRSQYSWTGASDSPYKYYLSVSDPLRKIFKQYLSFPEGYHLISLDTIDHTDFLFQSQDRILSRIKLYYSYIEQGNLKYSRSSGKLLKSSLTQMAKYCDIEEFFNHKDKNLHYLKTGLIINFFRGIKGQTQGVKGQTLKNPVELLQELFRNFFENNQHEAFNLYELLYHLKGGYYEYEQGEREKKVKKSLLKLLKDLPPSQWISLENIVTYCLYRDIYLEVIHKTHNELYFNKMYQGFGSSYERAYARNALYKDAVVVPLLKTMIFLFAAFGIVDIAYNFPENQVVRERNFKYLSVFDGLRYVRLTPLGAYITGLTKKYSAPVEEETADIVLDTKRLIITIKGKDPLKTLTLEKIGDKISKNCYKVNYQTFLTECATKNDIKQKITLFHTHLAAEPPQIWKDFLEDVLNRINPLVGKQKMAVYKLKQNKELISLVARDEILKQYILKGEDYHILIAKNNIPKVIKRLEEFGYFIDNI